MAGGIMSEKPMSSIGDNVKGVDSGELSSEDDELVEEMVSRRAPSARSDKDNVAN